MNADMPHSPKELLRYEVQRGKEKEKERKRKRKRTSTRT